MRRTSQLRILLLAPLVFGPRLYKFKLTTKDGSFSLRQTKGRCFALNFPERCVSLTVGRKWPTIDLVARDGPRLYEVGLLPVLGSQDTPLCFLPSVVLCFHCLSFQIEYFCKHLLVDLPTPEVEMWPPERWLRRDILKQSCQLNDAQSSVWATMKQKKEKDYLVVRKQGCT